MRADCSGQFSAEFNNTRIRPLHIIRQADETGREKFLRRCGSIPNVSAEHRFFIRQRVEVGSEFYIKNFVPAWLNQVLS